MELGDNRAKVRRVDRPGEEPILVALERLRRCPKEVADEFWPPDKVRKGTKTHKRGSTEENTGVVTSEGTGPGPEPQSAAERKKNRAAVPQQSSAPAKEALGITDLHPDSELLSRDEAESAVPSRTPLEPAAGPPVSEGGGEGDFHDDSEMGEKMMDVPAAANPAVTLVPRAPTPVDQGSQLGARRKSDEQGNKWDGRLRRRQSGTSTEDGRT